MFELIEKKEKRRLGVLQTMHGPIFTPAFGPDATRGLVKNIAPHELANLSGISNSELVSLSGKPQAQSHPEQVSGSDSSNLTNRIQSTNNSDRRKADEIQFLLTNTYHMRSYPGDEFIKDMGGLHEFMNWPYPILTDSGGFQVFSLIHGAKSLKGKVTDDGAYFNNPLNGNRLELTPEKAIDIQFNLGSDIMVVLDDCRHYRDDKELKKSVYRTIEWAKRCKKRFEENLTHLEDFPSIKTNTEAKVQRPLLFCVVQGGIDYDLREYCVNELVKIGFDGYGFGGWAINEKEYFPYDLLEFVADRLPEDKPRYAMGVGNPENMLECIDYGYDLFDCVIPSRNARHGLCYTTEGEIRIKNSEFKKDKSVLDKNLQSIASGYPKYYLHHLFKVEDSLGGELLTIHNLKYFNNVMRQKFD